MLKAFFAKLFGPKTATANKSRAHVMIRGERLQQGGYTHDIEKVIYGLHLSGWFRPHDVFMEMDLEGPRSQLEKLLEALQQVPIWSKVHKIEVSWNSVIENFSGIRKRN